MRVATTAPSVGLAAMLRWAVCAVIVRVAVMIAYAAARGLPHTHPVKVFLNGHQLRENAVYAGVYMTLPTWAVQAARAALLIVVAALLYSLLFDVVDVPDLLNMDHDPILHRPLHHHMP
jgi:hypothetical protein